MSFTVFLFFMLFPTLLLVGCIAYAKDWKVIRIIRDKLAEPSDSRASWCKLYSSVLFIILTLMHVAINCAWPRSYGIMISTAMLIFVANFTRTIGLAKAVTNRKPVAVFLMTITLAVTIAAYWNVDFLSSAMTLGFILLWCLIYPDYKYIDDKRRKSREENHEQDTTSKRRNVVQMLPKHNRQKDERISARKGI